MSIIGETRFVERNQFFNGQRLFASDLQGVEELNRQMRWLHNQSLHQPGIGAGFAISGNKGDRQVVIQPGYAIDADGREIVLTETVIEPVPPVAGDDFGGPVFFDLTVSYPDEHTLNAAETREGVCGTARGAIRLREAPVFCWVRLGAPPDQLPIDKTLSDAVVKGLHLRLARAQVLNCKLDRPLSLAQRRNAKPAEQPYMACDHATQLQWKLPNGPTSLGVGLQITASIDTKAAGFRTPPCYSAQLLGSREFNFRVNNRDVKRMLDGFVILLAASKSGFDFSLLVPDSLLSRVPENPEDPNPQAAPDFKEQLTRQTDANWTVDWIGVEG
ncbi:hypothetical protein [Variovorax sp. RA8]|uniref:hypothetical protein n=1 Tax=Variovorax sp. (strain JCM 16519 / RA8) TaxID=662548 RepID=UPI001316E26C|nr:hypothetical protein [Variovorax sp. RA8]VTU28780.1 hypothetical protein RA8CHR_03819 [Variovorax sp. RA8]